MLLTFWLSEPFNAMMLTLIVAFSGFAFLLAWLSFASPFAAAIQSCKGVVPPFVNISGTVFGLMLTFLAQDIWEANRQAERAVGDEREQLLTMRALGEVNGAPDETLRGAIREYVEAVVALEWPAMEQGHSAIEAAAALDKLTRIAGAASAEPKFNRALIETVTSLRSSREHRLAIANSFSDNRKWLAVLLLAFVTQLSLAATHLERARPQLLAQAIFSAAAVVSIALIASADEPFNPPDAISPQPLVEILALLPEKQG